MIQDEDGVFLRSYGYFYSPSLRAQKIYYYPTCVGHYFCDGNYHLTRDTFDSLQITYVVEGTLYLSHNGKTYTAEKNSAAIIDCFHPHEYYTKDYSELIWVHINGANCKAFYDEITDNGEDIVLHNASASIRTAIEDFLIKIGNNHNISEADLSMDVHRLLLDLSAPNPGLSPNTSHQKMVLDAQNYISGHLEEKLSVQTIADEVHLSPSHFSRIFKQQTGISLYDYILLIRLNKAKEFLQTTNLPVSEIAYKLGFGSDTSFITFFKKHTDLSPTKYRKLRF